MFVVPIATIPFTNWHVSVIIPFFTLPFISLPHNIGVILSRA